MENRLFKTGERMRESIRESKHITSIGLLCNRFGAQLVGFRQCIPKDRHPEGCHL